MKLILDKIKNKICTLTINRPEHYNALNKDLLRELDYKLDWILKDTDARIIILTGMGNKSFIAGADIKSMSQMNENEASEFSELGQKMSMKIEKFKIPILAAINGFALGGGCEIAMACHIRYCSTNAIFGQPEVGLGLIAGWGGTQRLPRLVGKGRALEILISSKTISSDEAYNIGLVNKVVPERELISSVEKLAKLIINNAPIAIEATISSVNNMDKPLLQKCLTKEKKAFSKLFNTKDTKEGMLAFLEKRSPDFNGE